MKENNRGFTLIELIVSLLIFSIVVAAAFGFMLSGARSYSSVSKRLNLQVQSQLAMNQLNNYIIDCDTGICFENDTLYIINMKTDRSYSIDVFQYKAADQCIYYGTGIASENGGAFTSTVSLTEKLSENVTGFSVATIISPGDLTEKAVSAEITIKFTSGAVSDNYVRIIALRNRPAIVSVQINQQDI